MYKKCCIILSLILISHSLTVFSAEPAQIYEETFAEEDVLSNSALEIEGPEKIDLDINTDAEVSFDLSANGEILLTETNFVDLNDLDTGDYLPEINPL
ncbi:MAG: hypothetical protein LIO44_05675 [Eubacterium sp.]|nr:hypothetical protein [Eubacterium sp.]